MLLQIFVHLASKIPCSASAQIMSMMMTSINNSNITDAQTEAFMECFNHLLALGNDSFRFPKSVATFKRRSNLDALCNDGIKYFAVCSKCHKLFPSKQSPAENEFICNQPLTNACYVPTKSGKFCDGVVYKMSEGAKPKPIAQKEYPYCSIIATLKNSFFVVDLQTRSLNGSQDML